MQTAGTTRSEGDEYMIGMARHIFSSKSAMPLDRVNRSSTLLAEKMMSILTKPLIFKIFLA